MGPPPACAGGGFGIARLRCATSPERLLNSPDALPDAAEEKQDQSNGDKNANESDETLQSLGSDAMTCQTAEEPSKFVARNQNSLFLFDGAEQVDFLVSPGAFGGVDEAQLHGQERVVHARPRDRASDELRSRSTNHQSGDGIASRVLV